MKSKFYQQFLVPVAFALCAATASAATVDYSNLSQWTASGDVAALSGGSSFVSLTNASFSFEDDAPRGEGALNVSGAEPTQAFGDMESFLGIDVGALDADFLNQATEGSAIKLTINVQAGDILTINWNLRTNDVVSGGVGGMDFFFLTVDDTVYRLGQASEASTASSSASYLWETGSKVSTFTFTTAGSYTIGLGVVDVTDYANTSSVELGSVTLDTAAIPEPQTYAMILGGLGALVLVSRRRKKLNA